MSVIHYRLCFDAPVERRWKTAEDFSAWCATHLSDFDYRCAGYTILDWADVPSRGGGPHWNVIVQGEASYRDGEEDMISYLAARNWKIDGITVLLYLKHKDENEILFPIHS